jgi:HSP20 family protein
MDYIKIRFINDFDQADFKSSNVAEDMFRAMNPLFALSERTLKPLVDVFETKTEIHVLAEIAGVDQKDLEIEIGRNTIKISGRRKQRHQIKKGVFRLAEIQYGPFERAFILPALVDPDNVSASYTNGMLHILLTKIPKDRTYEIAISDE